MNPKKKHSRKNPLETANFLSVLFFGWTIPFFWKGSKRDLQHTDLYDPLKSEKSEYLGDRLEREWNKELARANETGKDGQKTSGRQPNLIWPIIRVFWVPYMIQGLIVLIQATTLRLTQPLLQGWIVSYFDEGENTISKNQVLLYAAYLVIITLLAMFMNHHMVLCNRRIGMSIRVACCSLIYRKILRLDQAVASGAAAGLVANLISNDVSRFDVTPMFLHFLWITPIQGALVGYIMWKTVGVVALVGMGVMMMQSLPIQTWFSSLGRKFRAKLAITTDERVQLMSELVSGIKIVKMYSWEKPFELMISKVRSLEIRFIGYMSYLRGFDLSTIELTDKVSLYFTLITFVLMGNALTAEITFILVGLFALLQKTCNVFLSRAVSLLGETSVSMERITKFLLMDEVECTKPFQFATNNELHIGKETISKKEIVHEVGIEMVKVTASWVRDQMPPTLSEVSIKMKSRSLCTLVGPVGSGKSSLLHLVLGELPVKTGRLSLFTDETGDVIKTGRDIRISYASQDPWLFSATIRDNILFGQPYDEKRYQKVTRACALLEDFEQFPRGDLSFVGERGAILSGGQKARVNLARAVYRDADLYLLDDPLSAVDPRVGRHLFEECITGLLKDKTRILVTHQLQYLRHSDTVIVLNRGTVECQGTYDELVQKNVHILESVVLEKPARVENTVANHGEVLECEKTTADAGDDNQTTKSTGSNESSSDISEEKAATGSVSNKVYSEYFLAGGSVCWLGFIAVVFIAGQIALMGTDLWVTYWSNQESLRATTQSNESVADTASHGNNTRDELQQMHSTGSQWSDENGLLYPNLGIYIYTVIVIGCIFLVILRSMLFLRMCLKASRKVHDSVFANLLQATMRFFNTNPSGRILNRFTKDMGTMDEYIPRTVLETLQIFGQMFAIVILVSLANNWMILPAVVMLGLFYIMRNYYLKTAQDVKRLESIAKSPMFSHVESTLDGLTTIRSTGALVEGLLRRKFDYIQDAHTGAWSLNIALSTAFGFFLDAIACLFIACVCFSFILMDAGHTLGGFVGLAISQSLALTITLQHGVKQSTELITLMTSVERILEYTGLPKEGPFATDNPPPPTWPSEGSLIFKEVSLKYADHQPPVLKNLNLTINPGWKIGIVGRTGAGKSSLISALFRLTGDGLEGEIILDGIDTKSIGLHELRPRISIIPQEPILFSGSLRHNLDPFEQYSDAELWDSLREVELGNVVSSLDSRVAGGGANFSVGQRQLICLARAILRKNRILVLDEATANVDHGTDALIQNTIRQKFADCTVLTIAHRLNTVMDSDRVLVINDGRIVEFGHSHLLLKNRDGHFSRMLQQTGKTIAANLTQIAETSFLLRPESTKVSNEPPPSSLPEETTHL